MYWNSPHRGLIKIIEDGDLVAMDRYISEQIMSEDANSVWEADDIRMSAGRSLLHISAKYCDISVLRHQIEHHKCNVNSRNSVDLGTPLHTAASFDVGGQCVVGLQAAGADVNAASRSGWTVQHSAVFYDNVINIRLLLAHGANVDAEYISTASGEQQQGRENALSQAIKRKHSSAAYWQVVYGASLPSYHEQYLVYTVMMESIDRAARNASVLFNDKYDRWRIPQFMPEPGANEQSLQRWAQVERVAEQQNYSIHEIYQQSTSPAS